MRVARVATIEWLYPGARPPAAGDLLEAKHIVDFGAQRERWDVPDEGVHNTWRL
jgi:hypothetical protein